MKRSRVKNVLLDNLHKGFVFTCIAVTLYGTSVIGMRYYRYVTEIKPEAQKRRLMENQNLLAEGASEALKDVAPTLQL